MTDQSDALRKAIAEAINNLERSSSLDYPTSATPLTASSANVANSAATATLAATEGVTNYLTGFHVTSSGSTAASVVTLTVTGLAGGTIRYTYVSVAGVTTRNEPLIVTFPKPIPASDQNTAIVVSLPALGAGNTNATVVALGYQL